MNDTAATQKAKSRSRLRRKALAAATDAGDAALAPANDAYATEVAVELTCEDAALGPANDADEYALLAPSCALGAFPANLDESELAPFDPPDESDEIFRGKPEADEDALSAQYAPHAFAEDDELLLLTQEAGVDEACEFAAELEQELLLETEVGAAVLSTAAEDEELALLSPEAPADDMGTGTSGDAVGPAPAEDHVEAPVLEDEDLPPFDPPDDEESGFRVARLEDPDARPVVEPTHADVDETYDLLQKSGLARQTRPEQQLTDEPVPPISILISWDRAESAEMLEALAADPRLARADVHVERGGLAGAAAQCAMYGGPDLLILDTTANQADMLAGLDRLAGLTGKHTKTVVIGAVNDIGLLRELAARGIGEYIVPPTQPAHLARTICGFYAEHDKSQVIAVIGARGGVGASTVAHNIAWSVAERQDAPAALVDLDLSFGTAALDFRQDAPHSIADILKSEHIEAALERVSSRKGERLQILTAPATPACEVELDGHAVETLIAGVRRITQYVVLDLPHVWNEGVRQALASADDVLVVSSPDLASLRNTDNLLKHLKATRAKDFEPLVVLSMVGVPKRPEITFKDFAEAIGATPVTSFAFDPPLFGACAEKGQMLGEAAPRSKTALAFDALATALTGREPVERKRKPRKAASRMMAAEMRAEAAQGQAEASEQPAAIPLDTEVLTLLEMHSTAAAIAEDAAPAWAAIMAGREHEVLPLELAAALPEAPPEPEAEADALDVGKAPPLERAADPQCEQMTAAPAEAAPEQEQAPLELVEACAPGEQEVQPRNVYKLSATRARRLAPPRRKSSGLIRTAACLIAAIGLLAWYVEDQRQTAEAAEPQAAASVRMPLHRPAVELSAQYQRALQQIEAGQASEGAALLRQLAESGFVLAQYRLAKAHENGEGVETDLALARQWTERAAVGGNRQAMHDLGVYYSRGEGGARDDAAAYRWFRQAADLDVADSQFNLGVLYEQGRGVREDPAEALFWFMVAARHGDAAATARASLLEAQLGGMQIEQARLRVQAFQPRAVNVLANGVLAQGAAPAQEPTAEGPQAPVSDAGDVVPTPPEIDSTAATPTVSGAPAAQD